MPKKWCVKCHLRHFKCQNLFMKLTPGFCVFGVNRSLDLKCQKYIMPHALNLNWAAAGILNLDTQRSSQKIWISAKKTWLSASFLADQPRKVGFHPRKVGFQQTNLADKVCWKTRCQPTFARHQPSFFGWQPICLDDSPKNSKKLGLRPTWATRLSKCVCFANTIYLALARYLLLPTQKTH